MTSTLDSDDETQFITHLTAFKFNDDDKITSGLKILSNALKSDINLLELHFKYSVKGEGFEEAKKDYVERCMGMNVMNDKNY
jgi:hypothetical protein